LGGRVAASHVNPAETGCAEDSGAPEDVPLAAYPAALALLADIPIAGVTVRVGAGGRGVARAVDCEDSLGTSVTLGCAIVGMETSLANGGIERDALLVVDVLKGVVLALVAPGRVLI
jgi:hypothetical protein